MEEQEFEVDDPEMDDLEVAVLEPILAESPPSSLWAAVNPLQDDENIPFYGRDDVYKWVQRTLLPSSTSTEPPAKKVPLLLYGETYMGKTAVLGQMLQGKMGQQFVCLRLEARQLARRQEPWMWVLDRHLVTQFKAEGVTLPSLSKNSFMADPAANLRTKVLDLGFQTLPQHQHLLILIDDVDFLLKQSNEGRAFLFALSKLVEQYPRLHTLWTSTTFPDQLADQLNGVPFVAHRLMPLNPAVEARDFVRYMMPVYLFQEVADHIVRLTAGNPYYLRQFCRLLYEHGRLHHIRQISLTDVMAVARSPEYNALQPPLDPRTVPNTLIQASATKSTVRLPELPVNGRSQPASPPAPTPAPDRWSRWLVPFLVMGLLAAVAIWQLPPLWAGATATPTAVAVVQPTPTDPPPTATATAEPSPTPVPPTPTSPPADTPTPLVVIITATPEAQPTSTPTAEPTAEPETAANPDLLTRPLDGMPMRLIPAGTYLRGSEEDVPDSDFDERPVRSVSISAFYLDQYLVSVTQYAGFLNDLGTHTAACNSLDCARTTTETSDTFLVYNGTTYLARRGFEDYPINNVSWFGARDYCSWVGGRLPSEAEWEYAARGSDGRLYPWGNDLPNPARAVYGAEFANLLPVTALPDGASPFGVYQLAGSLWEWTNDWYAEDYYDWGATEDPPGAPQGEGRVVRGGSWTIDSTAERIRSANRNWFRPTALRADLGFRCAFDVADE